MSVVPEVTGIPDTVCDDNKLLKFIVTQITKITKIPSCLTDRLEVLTFRSSAMG